MTGLTGTAEMVYERALKTASPAERVFRERAWSEFRRLGWPGRNVEAWRYTDPGPVVTREWAWTSDSESLPAAAAMWRGRFQGNWDVIVLINGRLARSLSTISPETAAYMTEPVYPEMSFEDGFCGVAAASSLNGFHIAIPDGVAMSRGILVIRALAGSPGWSSTLSTVRAGRRSRVRVAEIFAAPDRNGAPWLRTDLTRVEVQPDASLEWVRLQCESEETAHYSDWSASVAAGACVQFDQVHSGAGWSRSNARAELIGRSAEVRMHGMTFGRRRQHSDQRIVIRHAAGETTSSQIFKCVLRGGARAVVNGVIRIDRGAQKVISSQMNQALLADPKAEADFKPELAIDADDVQATHGAAIGRMDEEKLFYLASRGIAPHLGRQMLAEAFVNDVVERIPVGAIRGMVRDHVREIPV